MGFYDRKYYGGQHDRPSGGLGGGPAQWSMVTWLIVINVVIFFLDNILAGSSRGSAFSIDKWSYFSVDLGVYHLQVWRWFTYQFIHAGFTHILFNMIGLYFFGRLLESWLGSRRFLAFYLLCGASGSLLFTALAFIPGLLGVTTQSGLVGASGSLFGILAACAVLFPTQRVMLLFPPIPMSMRTMAFVFMGIAVFSIIVGSANAGGEAAHLGGALLGFVLIRFPGLLGFAEGTAHLSRIKETFEQKQIQRNRQQAAERESEIDRILSKVKTSGIQSLTQKERDILQDETDRQRGAG